MTGRYRLVESIGQGGMGRVWRAADEMLDRQVAVKEMRIDGLDAEDTRTRRERTLREARATARIDHPNVVRVYDVVDEGERLWIVMELVAGRSLEQIVAQEGPLAPPETARIGLGLVAALRQVHAGGVLHRDIKPGNVLVERSGGRVVLTDFGIAAIQDAKALTMIGMLVGSPDYMAPERVSGDPQGPPSDIWSLGATLCAALGGRSPFSRDTTLATLHAVLYEEPVLPAAAGPLRDILAALLEKEPTVRAGLPEVEDALWPVAYPPPIPTLPVGEGRSAEHVRGPESSPLPDPRAEPDPVRDAVPQAATSPAAPPEIPPAAPEPLPTPPETPPGPPAAASELRSEARSETPSSNSAGPAPGVHPRKGVSLTRAEAETQRGPGHGPPGPRGPRTVGMPQGEPPDPVTPVPRHRTGILAAVGLVAVAAVVAVLLTMSSGGRRDDTHAGSSPASSVSSGSSSGATSTSTPSPTVEGTARPQSLPPGAHREAGGFAWATPEGWRRDVKTGSEVHYTSPDGRQELVGKSSLARGDLMDTWRTSEQSARQGRDYVKIRLEETTFQGHPAVVWEYTFTLKGDHWHARLLGFDVEGKSYQINTWYQPDIEPQALKTYDKVKESFTVL